MTTVFTSPRRVVELASVLVGRDLRVSYGGAVFGLLWSPATVIVQVAVLSFVFVRVVPLGVDDYPAFVFSGAMVWHLASSAINGGSEAFTANRDLVRRPGFPDAVLPFVTTARSLAAYLLGLPVLLAVLAVSGRFSVTALALPLVVLVTVVVVAGPAHLVATCNVRHRDIGHLVRVLLGVLFYATPVFYAEDRLPGRYQWVSDLNPLAGVVSLHRQVLYDQSWPDPHRLATSLAFAAAGAVLSALVFRRAAAHLADDL